MEALLLLPLPTSSKAHHITTPPSPANYATNNSREGPTLLVQTMTEPRRRRQGRRTSPWGEEGAPYGEEERRRGRRRADEVVPPKTEEEDVVRPVRPVDEDELDGRVAPRGS